VDFEQIAIASGAVAAGTSADGCAPLLVVDSE
jgi:hypothetical protein